MLVAAVFAPCPPLLIPDLAVGAAPELDDLRAILHGAVTGLAAAGPDLVVILGAADRGPVRTGRDPEPGPTGWLPDDAIGSMRGYGVELQGPAGGGGSGRTLPPAQTVGAWLLADAGWEGARRSYAVGPDTGIAEFADALADLDASRVAVLVMGDGSACRTEKAPGHLNPAAGGFDESIVAALQQVDLAALQQLPQEVCDELLVSGRDAWRCAAAAWSADHTAATVAGTRAELLYNDAPYGVGMFVATWVTVPKASLSAGIS